MTMTIQGVALKSVLPDVGMLARPLGHTGLCGTARMWVNEIFEKMNQVILTWRYAK